MSEFLSGKALEEKLTDIIWNAKKEIVIVSPFIKLDDYIKEVFEKIKTRHDIRILLLFGKNASNKSRSFHRKDFEFFTEFKNVVIAYHEDLHAKCYYNESEGIITSLNLYDYSMINNIEYGVHFSKSIIGTNKLYFDNEVFTNDILNNKAELVYVKVPIYSSKMLGFRKEYQDSKVVYDNSKLFFGFFDSYEKVHLNALDLNKESSFEEIYTDKPHRKENRNQKMKIKKHKGYCIRTGEKIDFNPNHPMSYGAWQIWNQFENYDYPESYCHETGEPSYGKTTMRNPILKNSF
ncbi:MAG: phospholipase D family protein [Flavobacteriales bacterium]|jgi:hypothetical protein|nr:phospholipase D family protein [Flavobacteriales bacterium]